MGQEMKKLGDAELEIMMIVWRAGQALTAGEILKQMERGWPLSTLMTVLSRLADKGFVHCDREARKNLYTAVVTEDAYKQKESSSFLEKLYGNSLTSLVACLYDNRTISERDLGELRALIDEIEGREDHA